MEEREFSTPCKLLDLEEVINMRVPVWDIDGSGDVRVKLDTDVNGQEWYVIRDDSSRGKPFDGIAYCWAFPHWNGAHDFYRYVPVAFCFKTFAELLEAHPTERAMWAYDLQEYAERQRLKEREQIASDRGLLALFGDPDASDEDLNTTEDHPL